MIAWYMQDLAVTKKSNSNKHIWKITPIVLGPGISAGAVLSAHADGLVLKTQQYAISAPTVSGLLRDPEISKPFAIAMIISAILLTVSILQVATLLLRYVREVGSGSARHFAILVLGVTSEMIAVAGMVVLSQFPGNVSSTLHQIGSYMLFFGHAIGISLVGYLIHDIGTGRPVLNLQGHSSTGDWSALGKFPRRSVWVATFSVLYGVVYFGGKVLPDGYEFWQGAIQSALEVLVILCSSDF